ncbi:LPXTG cell wall anchor domain-containing protein, partial [Acinetobacter baumannii]|uniref:LPXTG cell wall anchor domain-containing protein n=1 Tax=Acinetobacter baumannii TaxID=470 RepID=UPI00189701BF
ATDQIDGNTVTFPTASEHVITATHEPSGIEDSVTITVVATEAEDDDEAEPGVPDDDAEPEVAEDEEAETPADPGEPETGVGDPDEAGAPAATPGDGLPATGTEPALLSSLTALLLAAGLVLLQVRRRASGRV